ncbi:MAG: ATPase domain-containing protein, partial [Candidatus Nanohaloarchaea archaeon]|nr:ATPase domain-containing protein [Candidatus Nanohaloarchaea archaeon]
MPVTERVETGIEGLDDLLNGGIPVNHSVFLAGPAGSGKTTFCLEFLYRGAEKGENGLYISFEETKEQILGDLPFDWDLQQYLDSGTINVVKYDPYQYEDIIDLVRSSVKDNQAQRVV